MNDKQKKFCEEYVVTLNGSKAAINAGYSEFTSRQKAYELLSSEEVSNYILELQSKKSEELNISFNDVIKLEWDIALNGRDNDKLKALDQVSKKLGFYSMDNEQKKEVNNFNINDLVSFKKDV